MSDAGPDVGRTQQGTSSGSSPRFSRLPARQPLRAGVVVLAYLLAAGAVIGALSALYGTLGLILAGLIAAVLTVPVAVLAPVPRAAETEDPDERPILQRHMPKPPLSD